MNFAKLLRALVPLLLTTAVVSAQEGVLRPVSFADRLQAAKYVSLTELASPVGMDYIRALHVYPEAEWKKRLDDRAKFQEETDQHLVKYEAAAAKLREAQSRNASSPERDAAQKEFQALTPWPGDPYRGHTFYEVVNVGSDYLELRQAGKNDLATLLLQFSKIDKVYWHPQPAKE